MPVQSRERWNADNERAFNDLRDIIGQSTRYELNQKLMFDEFEANCCTSSGRPMSSQCRCIILETIIMTMNTKCSLKIATYRLHSRLMETLKFFDVQLNWSFFTSFAEPWRWAVWKWMKKNENHLKNLNINQIVRILISSWVSHSKKKSSFPG